MDLRISSLFSLLRFFEIAISSFDFEKASLNYVARYSLQANRLKRVEFVCLSFYLFEGR